MNDHVQKELYNDASVYFHLIKSYSELIHVGKRLRPCDTDCIAIALD